MNLIPHGLLLCVFCGACVGPSVYFVVVWQQQRIKRWGLQVGRIDGNKRTQILTLAILLLVIIGRRNAFLPSHWLQNQPRCWLLFLVNYGAFVVVGRIKLGHGTANSEAGRNNERIDERFHVVKLII